MSTKKILVVEDEEDLRRQFCEALGLEGYTTIEAGNGHEALEVLESLADDEYPDCIVLDLMMPIMNGEVFLDHIRGPNKNRFKSIPVIVTTARGSSGPQRLRHRVDAEIRKPFDLDDFFAIVATQVNQRVKLT